MKPSNKTRLALAALAVLAAGAVHAQSTIESAQSRPRTDANAQAAVSDAQAAHAQAQAAQQAAQQAEATRRAGAVTTDGAAMADYQAYQANQSSLQAQAAADAALNAANDANAAKSAVHSGTAQHEDATIRGSQSAGQARAAADAASAAAANAALAAQAAQDAANAPPPPPPPVPVAPDPAAAQPQVSFHSLPPDSVVGQYKVDFAALDANGNGSISRSEAKSNATLTAEFDAVDNNHDGRLDKHELAGWL
jgi:hypothetical protein